MVLSKMPPFMNVLGWAFIYGSPSNSFTYIGRHNSSLNFITRSLLDALKSKSKN